MRSLSLMQKNLLKFREREERIVSSLHKFYQHGKGCVASSKYSRQEILFSERNYKKQVQFFYQKHSLALHTVEIFCNLTLKNHQAWT